MLRFLVHVLFTFYIQGVLEFLNKFGGLRVNLDVRYLGVDKAVLNDTRHGEKTSENYTGNRNIRHSNLPTEWGLRNWHEKGKSITFCVGSRSCYMMLALRIVVTLVGLNRQHQKQKKKPIMAIPSILVISISATLPFHIAAIKSCNTAARNKAIYIIFIFPSVFQFMYLNERNF